jgi:hypothetical protein
MFRRACLIILAFFTTTAPGLAQTASSQIAELPRSFVDTSDVAPSGTTIAVPAGGDFQAALTQAAPGDVITLAAGATYTGNFILPAKAGSGWIIIRTSAPDASLPPAGTRITPASASVLAKIVSPNSGPALATAPGAHHYRFLGLEVGLAPGVTFSDTLVRLGDNETTVADVPHHLLFERVYIHGTPTATVRRGIVLNSAATAVVDSTITDIHEVGGDAQAIAGWNGPGPFKIVNNHLEGAGANVVFGGPAPRIADLVPADIEIRGNDVAKPLTWRRGDPTYAGTPWAVRTFLELTNARRVLIDGNLFEHNWADAGAGTAILFTVRNQGGTTPWSVVEDVTFTNNVVRHTGSGVGLHGGDARVPSQPARRILIKNNLFDDVSGARWGGAGRLFEASHGIEDLVIDHNTGVQDGSIVVADGGTHPRFTYRNNLTPHNDDGVHGAGTASGLDTLNSYFPDGTVSRNVIAGGNPALYPAANFLPPSLNDVGFIDLTGGDYRLSPASPYKQAGTDGKDIGADLDAIEAAFVAVMTAPDDATTPAAPITATAAAAPATSASAPTADAGGAGTTAVTAAACPVLGSCTLESGLVGRTDLLLFEDWEASNWLGHWTGSDFQSNMSAVTTQKFAGSRGLEMRVSTGQHDGASLHYDFTAAGLAEPDEVYFRYYVRFNNSWQKNGDGEIGKLPGFEGTYNRCGWGGRKADGTCWSARMMNFDTGTTNQVGFYVYHADMPTQYGEHMRWSPQLQRDRWYCLEQRVKLNAVGSRDGILQGWVDGNQVFNRGDLRFRTVSNVHVEALWFITYVGGSWSADRNMAINFDNAVMARNRIGCASSAPAPVPVPDTTLPTVSLTAPAPSATLSGTATASASATDNVGMAGVQFKLDGANLGAEDTTAPYSLSWNTTTASNGSHTVTAVARDTAGNLKTSAGIPVTVSNLASPPPPPPASGCQTSSTTWQNKAFTNQTGLFTAQFDLIPSAAAIDGVTGLSSGTASGYANLAAIVRFNTAGRIDARNGGAYAAQSALPYVAGSTYQVRMVVNVPAHTYSVYVTGPGAIEQPLGLDYAFRTEQNAVTGLNTLASYASPGTHQVCNLTVSPASPLADTTLPTVALTGPASGVTLSGIITVSASAADNVGVAGVQFKLDGATLGPEDTVAPYTLSWYTTTASNGAHTLTAVARDAAGNLETSAGIPVTVSNVASPPPPPPASGCQTSSTTWQNKAFTTQTGLFTARFDVIPSAAAIDGVTGLSSGTASGYTNLAAIVRFNTAGRIDARNGGAYAAQTALPYVAGSTYRVRMVVNVLAHTYSVYVTAPGAFELPLGLNYAFRMEQSAVTALNTWASYASAGAQQVCNFTVGF